MQNPNMSTAAWIRIDPDLARRYLSTRSDVQRKLSNGKVRTFARDMKEGRWHEHGQPIQFDTDGRLMDGQHRLEAIVLSGVTVKLLVVRGVPTDSFAYVDIGMRRTASQFVEGERRGDITFAANWLRLFEITDGTYRNWASYKNDLSIEDTVAYIGKHPEIVDYAKSADRVYRACRIHRGSHTALLYLVAKSPFGDVQEWLRGLTEGAGLSAGDPRLVLRERWIRESHYLNLSGGRTNSSVVRWARLVKAWNAYVQGRDITLLRYNHGEAPPLPIGV